MPGFQRTKASADDRRDLRPQRAPSRGASHCARCERIPARVGTARTASTASGQSLLHPSTRGRGRCW
jgi:hypothetical protein